jgi:hypothetical protein
VRLLVEVGGRDDASLKALRSLTARLAGFAPSVAIRAKPPLCLNCVASQT